MTNALIGIRTNIETPLLTPISVFRRHWPPTIANAGGLPQPALQAMLIKVETCQPIVIGKTRHAQTRNRMIALYERHVMSCHVLHTIC